MAIDVYLQLDGVKGESQDDMHKGWIECLELHWGVHQPRSATASTAGGHTAERVEMRDVTIAKLVDVASPILMQYCAMGKTLSKATVEFFRADGQGERVKYLEMDLENVLIGDYEPSIHSGTILTEYVSLKFSKIRYRYTQQKIGGGSLGSTVGGWDLATNRIAV